MDHGRPDRPFPPHILSRPAHRAKTLGGFTLHQPLPGLFIWRTPTGHWYQVDHTGTTPLGRDLPTIIAMHRGTLPHGTMPHGTWTPAERHLADYVWARAA